MPNDETPLNSEPERELSDELPLPPAIELDPVEPIEQSESFRRGGRILLFSFLTLLTIISIFGIFKVALSGGSTTYTIILTVGFTAMLIYFWGKVLKGS